VERGQRSSLRLVRGLCTLERTVYPWSERMMRAGDRSRTRMTSLEGVSHPAVRVGDLATRMVTDDRC
jgi:hypothetical protein